LLTPFIPPNAERGDVFAPQSNGLTGLRYVNKEQALFTASSNEYYVKVASTVEEALRLVEVGFEYVTDLDEKKIFRKRK